MLPSSLVVPQLRRTLGIFVPFNQMKRIHERRIVIPAVWTPNAISLCLGSGLGSLVEVALQVDARTLVVACCNAAESVSVHYNSRASFIVGRQTLGDVFMLCRYFDGSNWLALDFTLADLEALVNSICAQKQVSCGVVWDLPALPAGPAESVADEGSTSDSDRLISTPCIT